MTSIGQCWAICDHFELHTGQPVLASTLKQSCGVDRKQLREWERKGRLEVYHVTSPKGTTEKAYKRPKDRGVEVG
ncbi:hypothetical protein LSG31_00495 [Fodinisporobacter ferrooxydans]|uniref:HTH merR-type domain-containing protein n=1 Tax=Fodinisporobacter ferrooxydans TaxID=2901836 RepID=A0ABY4CJW0_9BACL|nr:hypothetical protein LSG31_00495 [Alicyclobacillaceae bacterium MYW30-H2]